MCSTVAVERQIIASCDSFVGVQLETSGQNFFSRLEIPSGKTRVTQGVKQSAWNEWTLRFLVMFNTDFRHQRSDAAADLLRKWKQL